MKRLKNSKIVNCILHIIGFSFCVMPPIACTLSYFPLWNESAKALSGGVLLLFLTAAFPLFKMLREHFKSPASYTVWLCLFLLFFALSKIADEMTVISFVGFLGNAVGAVILHIAKKRTDKSNE